MDSPTRYAGVDWASRAHAVCIVDGYGTATERFEVEHTEAGVRVIARRLAKAGVARVAIERPDGPCHPRAVSGSSRGRPHRQPARECG